jgi:hypothetical protein
LLNDAEIRVVVDVDESRRHGEAGSVDRARRGQPWQPPHRHDLSLPDRHISDVCGIAGTIDNAPAANHQIDVLCRRQHAQLQQQQSQFHTASVHQPYRRSHQQKTYRFPATSIAAQPSVCYPPRGFQIHTIHALL